MIDPKLNKKKGNGNDAKKEEKKENTTNEKEENEIYEEKKEDTKINKKDEEEMKIGIKKENKNNDKEDDKKDEGGDKNEIIIEKGNNNINSNNIPLYFNIMNKNFRDYSYNQNILNQNINNTIPTSTQILHIFSKQNILKSLMDQNQTRYLQEQLGTISKETIDYIIGQLKGIFREIMKDKNGNYFCSDLFKECDQEQRIKILTEISLTLSDDCLNNYASHAIQALIDRASSEYEYRSILYSFNDYNKLLYVSIDPCGAYTVQKIIERIPDRYREEFNFIFSPFIVFISRQKYGIVTVKKFISGTKSSLIRVQIMRFVEENFMNLAVDQYANYLIQFLLEKWNNTPEGKAIKKMVRDNFEKMCAQKYSSFICELYIKIISPEERKELFESLNVDKFKRSNNHNSNEILKILHPNKINNYKSNKQISKNGNNNMNNSAHFMSNNNYFFNNQNYINSNFYGINNNSNENNIINNFNIPFNNANSPNDNF